MTRIGRRFVPSSTIARRCQAQDDRRAAELQQKIAAFRERTSNAALFPTSPPVPVVVEVALEPVPSETRGPVVDTVLVPVKTIGGDPETIRPVPDTPHTTYPKPSRVARAIAQTDARTLDRRKLVAWAFAVKSRDQWRDRRTGARLVRTLNLDPNRAEAHHLVSRDVRAVRYDVRNGITLSLVTHDAVERGLYRIEGSAWFTVGGVTYIDASAPVRFVRT